MSFENESRGGVAFSAQQWGVAIAIIAASITTSLTVPPILPRMFQHFAHWPGVTVLVPLVVALPPLVSTIAAPLAGWLSDRVGRRTIVLWASLLSVAVGILPYFLDSLTHILITRALIGITTGALLACTSAMIADFFAGPRRQEVLGAKYAVLGIAHVCVFIIVGQLAATSWRNAFWIFLWGILAALLVVLLIPPETRSPSRNVRSTATPISPVPWRRFAPIFAGVYLGIVAFDVLLSGVPFLLVERGIGGTQMAGITAAIASAGMFSGSTLYPFMARRVAGRTMWCVTFVTAAIGYAILSSATTLPVIFFGTYVVGTGCGLVSPNSLNLLLSAVPPDARGRVAGGQTTCFFLGLASGPLIGITVAKLLGSSALLMSILSATMIFVALVYAGLAVREKRRAAVLPA